MIFVLILGDASANIDYFDLLLIKHKINGGYS